MCRDEDSFTKVSNKLMDALEIFQGTVLKYQILVHLIRRTAGFHRESVLTSAAAIASSIRRNKIKTGLALNELIECGVVIADSKEGPCRTRRLSINMNTMEWRNKPLPAEAAVQKNAALEGNSEVSLHDTQSCNPGNFEPSLEGSSGVSRAGYTPSDAYIDGKNENSCPKENIKEKERNIYMYDITLIPPTLSEMPGFKKAFNNWLIYKQEVQRPLTAIGIEIDMRKLLLYNSEGYNVISIIENAITTGWLDLYRPGSRQESPAKQVEYKSVQDIINESY